VGGGGPGGCLGGGRGLFRGVLQVVLGAGVVVRGGGGFRVFWGVGGGVGGGWGGVGGAVCGLGFFVVLGGGGGGGGGGGSLLQAVFWGFFVGGGRCWWGVSQKNKNPKQTKNPPIPKTSSKTGGLRLLFGGVQKQPLKTT